MFLVIVYNFIQGIENKCCFFKMDLKSVSREVQDCLVAQAIINLLRRIIVLVMSYTLVFLVLILLSNQNKWIKEFPRDQYWINVIWIICYLRRAKLFEKPNK